MKILANSSLANIGHLEETFVAACHQKNKVTDPSECGLGSLTPLLTMSVFVYFFLSCGDQPLKQPEA